MNTAEDIIHAAAALTSSSYAATVYKPSSVGIVMANHDDLSIYCRISAGASESITVSLEQQLVAGGSWVAADVLTVGVAVEARPAGEQSQQRSQQQGHSNQ